MGIAILVEGLQAAVVHDLVDVIIEFLLAHQTVLTHRLTDDLAHGHTGLQRGEGILEDDLHLRAHIPHFLVGEGVHILAVEQYLTASLFTGQTQDGTAGGGVELENGSAQGGLAAAGLAHQTHGSTTLEVKGDTVHGLHMAHSLADHTALDGEVLLQVLDLQNVLGIILQRRFNGFLLVCHGYSPTFPSK